MHVEVDPDTRDLVLHSRWGADELRGPAPVVREALRRMTFGPITLDNVTRDPAERAEIGAVLDRFAHLVVRSVASEADRPLLSVVPLAPEARFRFRDLAEESLVRLSRFAVQWTEGDGYLLESPLSLHKVVLHDSAAARITASLGRPVRPRAVQASGPSAAEMLGHLVAAGMVVVAEPAEDDRLPVFAEDIDPVLKSWRPLDLMFHVSTSLGRHDKDVGMTYRLEQGAVPEPVVAKPRGKDAIDLYRPRFADLLAADPPFSAVLEGYRTVGGFGLAVPTAQDVAELLYRTARVRSLFEEARAGHPPVTVSERPYPTTGSCHPFEMYLAVHACDGLPRGVYHYDPLGHRLETVPAGDADVAELIESAQVGAGLVGPPPVLLAVTARFRRIAWKYNGLSYVLLLKDLGHLVQTVLLASAAMGLAAATVTTPDIALATRILGTDWRTEPSIGWMVLGVPAQGEEKRAPVRGTNDAEWGDRSASILAEKRRKRLP
ncbi:SagB family peptide dehydrogenase [Spirillospora sp. CA-255316]